MSRVLRYEIPVDGAAHLRVLPGPPLHVAARRKDVVELWCQDAGEERTVTLCVVGTGHPWPAPATHVGTALVPPGDLVWHLLALGPSSVAPSMLHGGLVVGPEDQLVFVTRDRTITPAQLQEHAARLPDGLRGRVVIVAGAAFDAYVVGPGPVCIDCGGTIESGAEWTVYDAATGLSTRGLCPPCGQRRC